MSTNAVNLMVRVMLGRPKAICIVILLSLPNILFGQANNQTDTTRISNSLGRSKILTGLTSIGTKNTYGAWGVFVGRGIDINKSFLEIRIGCGIKESFVIGGGLNYLLFNNKRRFELFVATDYSYHFSGTIRFDDEKKYKPYTSDSYSVSECHYFHSYITSRVYIDKYAALQLKTGYAFLLNDVEITPTYGPNVNTSKTQNITDSGIMVGIDLVLFIKYNQDFRKKKQD